MTSAGAQPRSARVPTGKVPVLYDRQKRLLALLHALGGAVGHLDFQKLLFLYCKAQDAPPYDFVPYRFGAFSFQSYADRRKLTERGLLEEDERTWRLTPAGRKVSRHLRGDFRTLASFVVKYRAIRGDALIAETYRMHPYYAARSEIATKVLGEDGEALRVIERARPTPGQPSLVTIGYEGRTLEGYLNILLQAGVTVLCDVRRNPISRKYGFSKRTLAHACTNVGIRYEHLPQLGIASEERRGLSGEAEYRALFKRYALKSLPLQQGALGLIQGWVLQGDSVALTCFERSATMCHRHCVADALAEEYGQQMVPKHL